MRGREPAWKSGKPLALQVTVPFMPSARALDVIIRAKFVSGAAEHFSKRGRGIVSGL